MTDDNLSDDQLHLLNIFHPFAMEMINKARKNNTRFVHYTSADAAAKILETKQVWLRKTSCMNDYMEVRHGLDWVRVSYGSDGFGLVH